jgi:hypothetical protein
MCRIAPVLFGENVNNRSHVARSNSLSASILLRKERSFLCRSDNVNKGMLTRARVGGIPDREIAKVQMALAPLTNAEMLEKVHIKGRLQILHCSSLSAIRQRCLQGILA